MRQIIHDRPAGLTINQKVKAGWNSPVVSATDLAMEFKWLFRYLQFFGSFPVYLVPKNGNEIAWEFKAKFLSCQTVFPCMTSAMFFLLVWTNHTVELFSGNLSAKRYELFFNFTRPDSPESEEKMGYSAGYLTLWNLWNLLCLLLPIQVVSTLVASWMDAPTFAKLFNEWVKLETEFLDVCCWAARIEKDGPPSTHELKTSSVTLVGLPKWRRRYYLYLVVIPMMVVIPCYLYINVHFYDILEDVIAVAMALHFIAYPYANAMTAAMMYRCMACAFQQTCGAMDNAWRCGRLNPANVTYWRCFVEKLRAQCNLTAKAYKRTDLIYVGLLFLLLTIVTFTLFNGNRSINGSALVITILSFYGIGNLLTLLIKVWAAEQITHEESAIAQLVASVPTQDLFMLQELKFIHEMITTQPSEISVGDYVTLNRRLILSMIGQISTYLIVLMQFLQTR